jgi:hypothetical protein
MFYISFIDENNDFTGSEIADPGRGPPTIQESSHKESWKTGIVRNFGNGKSRNLRIFFQPLQRWEVNFLMKAWNSTVRQSYIISPPN